MSFLSPKQQYQSIEKHKAVVWLHLFFSHYQIPEGMGDGPFTWLVNVSTASEVITLCTSLLCSSERCEKPS